MNRPLTPREALLSRLASYAAERGLTQLDLPPGNAAAVQVAVDHNPPINSKDLGPKA
jgi:hypothetical protein